MQSCVQCIHQGMQVCVPFASDHRHGRAVVVEQLENINGKGGAGQTDIGSMGVTAGMDDIGMQAVPQPM